MPATGKSEVHALQYAVCMFINVLDRVLCNKVKGWEANDHGLNLEFSYRNGFRDVNVQIVPVGWPPGSHIHARFDSQDNGKTWDFWEGYIRADHLRVDGGKQLSAGFQMRTSATWDHAYFHCIVNEAASFFAQAVREAGFNVLG